MSILGRILCSNPFSFALGVGVGLVGLYIASKAEEQRKLENMQREIESAVQAFESGKIAVLETGNAKSKK